MTTMTIHSRLDEYYKLPTCTSHQTDSIMYVCYTVLGQQSEVNEMTTSSDLLSLSQDGHHVVERITHTLFLGLAVFLLTG